jgi:formate-dependent phosphoribosylglycinamide formyltransferase (GAR transformylase)
LDIPVPKAIATAEVDFAGAAARLGVPFVMQSPGGAGGQGTYLIRAEDDVRRALDRMPHIGCWLLSRFCGELTVNASGIVHADGVSLLPISIQTSGVERLGVGFGAYCGSDFAAAAALPAPVLRRAEQIALRIGQWLRERGHRGVFGADIAVDGQEPAVLEVNPRIQGSSWLIGCLEQHVLAILGATVPSPAPVAAKLPGSHLLVRWSGPAGVIHALPEPAEGVTALPSIGTTVLPGAIIARIESRGSLAEPTGRDLTPQTHALLDKLLGAIEITTAQV